MSYDSWSSSSSLSSLLLSACGAVEGLDPRGCAVRRIGADDPWTRVEASNRCSPAPSALVVLFEVLIEARRPRAAARIAMPIDSDGLLEYNKE